MSSKRIRRISTLGGLSQNFAVIGSVRRPCIPESRDEVLPFYSVSLVTSSQGNMRKN